MPVYACNYLNSNAATFVARQLIGRYLNLFDVLSISCYLAGISSCGIKFF